MITTWFAVGIAFFASSIASSRLAKERGRDEYFYFFFGLLVGPIALLVVLTPSPVGFDRKSKIANKPIRFIQGQPCPECGREVGIRSTICPHCRANLEMAWWENSVSIGQS